MEELQDYRGGVDVVRDRGCGFDHVGGGDWRLEGKREKGKEGQMGRNFETFHSGRSASLLHDVSPIRLVGAACHNQKQFLEMGGGDRCGNLINAMA